ncbi:MAG: hypothetical protein QNK20_11800 [Aureibaculum sp.]|nr:hypothetical protein [Aureibaculum sp.]
MIFMKEKDQKDEKKVKIGRQRYFQMFLNLGLCGPKLNLWTKHMTSLIDLLLTSGFVSQPILEKTLYHLIIEDRGRAIYFEDFDGQLERDSRGMPYWNVYLQTSALTTSRCIAKSVSKKLFNKTDRIDPAIQIRPLSQFQRCQREELFTIPNSSFYPGYFSWITVKLIDLLKTDQVKEAIKKTPEKYRVLIDGIDNSDEVENIKI